MKKGFNEYLSGEGLGEFAVDKRYCLVQRLPFIQQNKANIKDTDLELENALDKGLSNANIYRHNVETISPGFIKITHFVYLGDDRDLEHEQFYDFYYYFRHFHESSDESNEDDLHKGKIATTLINGPEIRIINSEKIIRTAEKYYPIHRKKLFKLIFEEYVRYSLIKCDENNQILRTGFGWNFTNGKKTFFGVTEKSPIMEIDNAVRISEKNREDTECDIRKAVSILSATLNRNREFIPLICYTYLAIAKHWVAKTLLNIYAEEEFAYTGPVYPALQLYGNNSENSINAIANVFLNMFAIDFRRINSIKRSMNINLDSSKSPFPSKGMFNNIPIIFFSHKGSISRRIPVIKKIINTAENRFFPVILNRSNLNLEEIYAVDISQINNLNNDPEKLKSIRASIDELQILLIRYIERENDEKIYQYLHKNLKSVAAEFINNPAFDEVKLHYALMFIGAILVFDMLLHDYKLGKDADVFRIMAVRYFRGQSYADDLQDKEYKPDAGRSFVQYIMDIFESRTRNVGYAHWEGVERNGFHESCYYLDHKEYFADFSRYFGTTISELELNRALKERNIIKTRTNAASTGQYRKYNGEKIYALVVPKDNLQKDNEDAN